MVINSSFLHVDIHLSQNRFWKYWDSLWSSFFARGMRLGSMLIYVCLFVFDFSIQPLDIVCWKDFIFLCELTWHHCYIVKTQFRIIVRNYFCTLYFAPLICLPFYCIDYCSSTVSLETHLEEIPIFSCVCARALVILGPLHFVESFRITCQLLQNSSWDFAWDCFESINKFGEKRHFSNRGFP